MNPFDARCTRATPHDARARKVGAQSLACLESRGPVDPVADLQPTPPSVAHGLRWRRTDGTTPRTGQSRSVHATLIPDHPGGQRLNSAAGPAGE